MSTPTLNDYGITQHPTIVVTDEDLLRDYLIERGHDHTNTSRDDTYSNGVLSAAAMSADGQPLLVVLDTAHADDADDPFDAPLHYLSADRVLRNGCGSSRYGVGEFGAAGSIEHRPQFPLTLLTPRTP